MTADEQLCPDCGCPRESPDLAWPSGPLCRNRFHGEQPTHKRRNDAYLLPDDDDPPWWPASDIYVPAKRDTCDGTGWLPGYAPEVGHRIEHAKPCPGCENCQPPKRDTCDGSGESI